MPKFTDRLKHAWNAFLNKDPTANYNYGNSSYYNPNRRRLYGISERSIVTSVLSRISVDAASVDIMHVRLDENNRYIETIDSSMNECFTVSANKDQTSRAFFQDVVMSMLDEGVIAIVPIDTTIDITKSTSFDINSLRTGRIEQWYPDHVKVEVYNDRTGGRETIVVPKSTTAIVENPFYSVMNEPNSTLQRLIRKLLLLDNIDEKAGSNKLDLIIQLPYIVKSEARKKQADDRLTSIRDQLASNELGIAYTDATEKITQLNRPLENQLLQQVEYLQGLLYSQLGLTKEIMDGTASQEAMSNYYSRTIEPILSAIVDEMKRKFLTKTARSQKQSIEFFRDPFKLVPVSDVAEIADKFTRNEIMTSNEVRQIIGMKPSKDPNADELRNKNISASGDEQHFDKDGNLIGQPDQNYDVDDKYYNE